MNFPDYTRKYLLTGLAATPDVLGHDGYHGQQIAQWIEAGGK
jgi:hypothetical protein